MNDFDSLVLRYAPDALSLEEKAKAGILPDQLSVADIARLWHPEDAMRWKLVLLRAINKGLWTPNPDNSDETIYVRHPEALQATVSQQRLRDWIDEHPGDDGIEAMASWTMIDHDDFRDWLDCNNAWPLSADCLLIRWWDIR